MNKMWNEVITIKKKKEKEEAWTVEEHENMALNRVHRIEPRWM